MSFRSVTKEQLTGQVPCDLATTFRERAGRERKTISELMTELLSKGLGLDPRSYGIEPAPRKRRKTEPEPAATT